MISGWTSSSPAVLASFMASTVEFVEALTIVLAVGVVRGWRSALLGTAAGLAVLAALVLALGRSLSSVPLPLLQLVVGVLLLMFGMRWLRKAVLRAAGVLPLHDEADAYASQTRQLRGHGEAARVAVDKIAFIASFKTVMLEGLEVVFIVIALGAGGRMLMPAAAGAGLALAMVVALGVALHRPLARVPENTLKFGVGIMLTAFGTFWVGEGIGLDWPGSDAATFVLMATFLGASLALVAACRRLCRTARAPSGAPARTTTGKPGPRTGAAAELLGLFVDDGWLAGGIVLYALAAWTLEAQHPYTSMAACILFAGGLPFLLAISSLRRASSRQ
jgi:uncharacterized membrane protein